MATRGRKAAKRTTAPKRTRSIHKSKSVRAKSAPKTARPKPGRLKSAAPKSGKQAAGKSQSETATLKHQLRTAQDRQTASAEILRTIGTVSGDAERSLYRIAEITKRLFEASSVSIFVAEGDRWGQIVHDGAGSKRVSAEVPADQLRIGGHSLPGATFSENRQIHLPDIDNVDPAIADWPGLRPSRAAGTRTLSGTPLRRAGHAIGVLIVHRNRLAPFTADELALLQSFADQAAIAIENARLFNETKEALERQTATADILKVIASSPDDVRPVFEAIVANATRLIDGFSAGVYRFVDDVMHLAAFTPVNPAADEMLKSRYPRPIADIEHFRKAHAGKVWQVADTEAQPDARLTELARVRGFRSLLCSPLMSKGKSIGVIAVSRRNPGPFSAHHIQLLQTFADQAVIAIENVRLFNEVQAKTGDLSEALERQTATSEVLAVISRSPSDLNPVLEAISDTAARLCGSEQTMFFRYDGDVFRILASWNFPPEVHEMLERRPLKPGHPSAIGRAGASLRPVCIPDVLADPDYGLTGEQSRSHYRATLAVPLLREGRLIGAISLNRGEPGAFTEKQIELVTTFADQAAIAIENTRLFNETQEALERQTATADILKVIASSPDDVQPVFEAIAASANRLLDGFSTAVCRFLDGNCHLVAFTPTNPAADEILKATFPLSLGEYAPLGLVQNGETVQFADTETAPEFQRQIALARGFRSVIWTPLMNNGVAIGLISLTRVETGAFADHHIQLLQTFADQAVIAIENVRLFNETKEALEQQHATSEVLQVIGNSVADTAPVFEKILDSCQSLFATEQLGVFLALDGQAHVAAWRGRAFETMVATFPKPLEQTATGLAIQNRSVLYIPSTAAMPNRPAAVENIYKRIGDFSAVWAPMLRGGRGVGVIVALREPPSPFSEKEIALLETFADQAAIAIENTRLFNETREALERQTATADILKVIASSPDDVQPVFSAIAASANALLGGFSTAVFRFVGDIAHLAAFTPTNPAADSVLQSSFPMPLTDYEPFELAKTGQPTEITDTERMPNLRVQEIARMRGFRSMLFVPLMSSEGPIGLISVTRTQTGSFAQHHVQLLQTFADQAVIAISNVELFQQVQARTTDLQESLQQQTATADVLKVISRSAFDLQPVLDTLVGSAAQLCGADAGVIWLRKDDLFHAAAASGFSLQQMAFFRDNPRSIHDKSLAPRVLRSRRTVHIPDRSLDPEFAFPGASSLPSTMLGVPLLRDDRIEGVFTLARSNVAPFGPRQIELVETFADQAVIAIENARLFKALQQRTGELAQSLDDLRAAQDRLVQTEKLASLGQLTAGIAHEIKNPLNFVNNFAALSAELTDELNDALRPVALDSKVRQEVDELTGMLKDNLEKVVQHGKRADSIVKNMLLHSREGSGEQRPADINTLLDESLNLAYHGARAEKSAFNITLQRDFDADAGEAELFPQEITRAFLNFISNGFYAATKRKAENGDPAFEPLLAAVTRNLGDSVEIRIRDNGTGIPAEVREKMFNPFFTTKPAGEGTGLGLSMSHDIIVKQHGGSIDVETEPGQFTELRIILPRRGRR